jgi:hypothetical protein
MSAERIRLRLEGTRPLLMHSGRLADPLDPAALDLAHITAKRPKTRADLEEISRREWYGGLWLHGGRPCIPQEALEGVFVDAARATRRGKAARAGVAVEHPALLIYPGPSTIDELWLDENFKLRHAVKIQQAKTMRTRPRFSVWAAEFEVEYFPSLFDRRAVVDTFVSGGFCVGIGDWRPKFGRFSVREIS